MKADTRMFGKIEIEDSKIITLEQGIIGFPDIKNFALIQTKGRKRPLNGFSLWTIRCLPCQS